MDEADYITKDAQAAFIRFFDDFGDFHVYWVGVDLVSDLLPDFDQVLAARRANQGIRLKDDYVGNVFLEIDVLELLPSGRGSFIFLDDLLDFVNDHFIGLFGLGDELPDVGDGFLPNNDLPIARLIK